MQLLLVPAMLTIGGFWLNKIQKDREEDVAKGRQLLERENREDNRHEVALQAYIDKISELLLEKHSAVSKLENEEVRKIARVRTLRVLRGLDGARKGSVLQFLYESGLIEKGKSIIEEAHWPGSEPPDAPGGRLSATVARRGQSPGALCSAAGVTALKPGITFFFLHARNGVADLGHTLVQAQTWRI